MELTQLHYFVTLAEQENMSYSAEKLHISQPALSISIKKLEDELKVKLFERRKNRLILNENGKLALTYAKAVLDKATEMKNIFKQFIHKDNCLSIAFDDHGPMRFSIPRLQKEYPNLEIMSDVLENEEDFSKLLHTNKYDAVISSKNIINPNIVTMPFAEERLYLSIPADNFLKEAKTISLKEIPYIKIAAYYTMGVYSKKLRLFFENLKSHHHIKNFNDYFLLRQFLEKSDYATFTTKLVKNYRNDGENRHLIPISDEETQITYYLSYLKNSQKNIMPLLEWTHKNTYFLLD